MEDEEDHSDEPSPIIQLFERVSFERGHEIHDQVASMVELFSSSEITLDMLDVLVECIKTIFVHPHLSKNTRIFDFLTAFTHVTHLNYASNKNLSLVFDALMDIYSQMLIAVDSQIRYSILRLLNQLQNFVDLSRSPFVPDQLELHLLDLLTNESTLNALDEILPLAGKFQEKNPRFIDAFLRRIHSPKWALYLDRRRRVVSLLRYSPASLAFLLSNLEAENELSQSSLESLLADERGFTLNRLGSQGRLVLWTVASSSRDLSRLILTRWISQNGGRELVDILQPCQISTFYEQKNKKESLVIEKALRYFLEDENIRRIVINSIKLSIGTSKGGLLPTMLPNYIEHLYLWRLLCQLVNEEDDQGSVHPDFHEFLSYSYRLIKSSLDQSLSSTKIFVICQYALVLSTFDMLDIYRRKCLEAMGRCMLVHFAHHESITEHALNLIHLVHPSSDTIDERYQLITYTLNDLIQRCEQDQDEEVTFKKCITLVRVFVEHEKSLEANQLNFQQLIHSLIQSGLAHGETEIQHQTLMAIHTLVCHSRDEAVTYIRQIYQIMNKTEHQLFKSKCLAIVLDVILMHGLEILNHLQFSHGSVSEFLEDDLMQLVSSRNTEMKQVLVLGLMKLLLSSRLSPTMNLLQLILNYRFSTDERSMTQQQRDDITAFFYFFIHSSSSHVHLMEQLTIDLVSHSLAFVSDPSTLAYRTILTEPMCSFCLELLSLPTLPVEKFNEEHPHYHLAKSLLDSIHTTANNRTSLIIKSYLNIIKQLQFQFMTEEELQTLHDLILRLRQYPNLSVVVVNLIKSIEDQLKSSLARIEKLTHGHHEEKRARSPSPTSSMSVKRLSSHRTLQDRTNQTVVNPDQEPSSKGTKRKLSAHRYLTLDFENDTDEFF